MIAESNNILKFEAFTGLLTLPDDSIDCIITSPPYWGLRDYGDPLQIGLEPTLNLYLTKMLAITAQCKRVLKKSGTMFWNHGDSYAGSGKGFGDTEPDPKFKTGGRSRTIAPVKYLGFEINQSYIDIAEKRLKQQVLI